MNITLYLHTNVTLRSSTAIQYRHRRLEKECKSVKRVTLEGYKGFIRDRKGRVKSVKATEGHTVEALLATTRLGKRPAVVTVTVEIPFELWLKLCNEKLS